MKKLLLAVLATAAAVAFAVSYETITTRAGVTNEVAPKCDTEYRFNLAHLSCNSEAACTICTTNNPNQICMVITNDTLVTFDNSRGRAINIGTVTNVQGPAVFVLDKVSDGKYIFRVEK